MPNAKDAQIIKAHKFLVLGKTGAGKSAGLLTLPGKKFVYCFDPNALLTYAGHDIEYEEFLPENLSMKATSLSDKQRKRIPSAERAKSDAGHKLYQRWETDFETKLAENYFEPYNVIGFDSMTTLSDMVMDSILAINGRAGQWPQQDDYGPQMLAVASIVRTATAIGKTVYFTGHVETVKDEVTSRIMNQPMLTGRLRAKIPLLFSEILLMSAESDARGNVNYTCQTKPDRLNEVIRCTLKNSEFKEVVTINWDKPIEGQGIGRLYSN